MPPIGDTDQVYRRQAQVLDQGAATSAAKSAML